MSASNVILSAALFAGLIFAGDYVIFTQHNKVLAIAGQDSESYWGYLSRRISATRAPDVETMLAGFLPPAPAGWTRTPYVRADGEAVTARRYIPTFLAVDTTNDMLGDLEADLADSVQIAETYTMGDRRVIISVTHRPADGGFGLTSRLVAEVTLAIGSSAGSGPVYGVVKGAVFHQKPQVNHDFQSNTDTPVEYRHFTAGLGEALEMLVVTNASDAEVQTILGGIDMVGLASIGAVPESIVNEYRPTAWGSADAAEVLSEAAAEAFSESERAAVEPTEDRPGWGLFDAVGKTAPAESASEQMPVAEAEANGASLLDLAKPAPGTCVRRAGTLVCP